MKITTTEASKQSLRYVLDSKPYKNSRLDTPVLNAIHVTSAHIEMANGAMASFADVTLPETGLYDIVSLKDKNCAYIEKSDIDIKEFPQLSQVLPGNKPAVFQIVIGKDILQSLCEHSGDTIKLTFYGEDTIFEAQSHIYDKSRGDYTNLYSVAMPKFEDKSHPITWKPYQS